MDTNIRILFNKHTWIAITFYNDCVMVDKNLKDIDTQDVRDIELTIDCCRVFEKHWVECIQNFFVSTIRGRNFECIPVWPYGESIQLKYQVQLPPTVTVSLISGLFGFLKNQQFNIAGVCGGHVDEPAIAAGQKIGVFISLSYI